MFPLPKTIARFASRKTDSFCSTAKYLRDNLAHSHSKLKVPNHVIGTPVRVGRKMPSRARCFRHVGPKLAGLDLGKICSADSARGKKWKAALGLPPCVASQLGNYICCIIVKIR